MTKSMKDNLVSIKAFVLKLKPLKKDDISSNANSTMNVQKKVTGTEENTDKKSESMSTKQKAKALAREKAKKLAREKVEQKKKQKMQSH